MEKKGKLVLLLPSPVSTLAFSVASESNVTFFLKGVLKKCVNKQISH